MSYELISGNDVQLVSGDDVDLVLGAPWGGMFGRGGGLPQRTPYGGGIRRSFQTARGYGGGGGNFMQNYAQQRMANAGLLLRQRDPGRAGRIVLGMNSSGTVAAAASTNITARPQSTAFKPERIVIPASVAPDFTIQDIKCGNVSQLAQSGDLAAEAFVQTVFGGEMDMATVQTSQDFVLAVTNISGAARTFRAVVYGHAVY
jgi:hypothetical protein